MALNLLPCTIKRLFVQKRTLQRFSFIYFPYVYFIMNYYATSFLLFYQLWPIQCSSLNRSVPIKRGIRVRTNCPLPNCRHGKCELRLCVLVLASRLGAVNSFSICFKDYNFNFCPFLYLHGSTKLNDQSQKNFMLDHNCINHFKSLKRK